MILLAAFFAALTVAALAAVFDPCSIGRHKPNRYGLLCPRCGAVPNFKPQRRK